MEQTLLSPLYWEEATVCATAPTSMLLGIQRIGRACIYEAIYNINIDVYGSMISTGFEEDC